MCIVYVYARLAWAFYFCRQDSFLVCMHCHLLSNQKGWIFLLIETSGPIACQVILSCLLVPMLRDVCVCVMFVSVSASEKGTEGDDERRENRISCSKPHLWWQQHVSFYLCECRKSMHIWMDGCTFYLCFRRLLHYSLPIEQFQDLSHDIIVVVCPTAACDKGGFVTIHKSKTRQLMQNLYETNDFSFKIKRDGKS